MNKKIGTLMMTLLIVMSTLMSLVGISSTTNAATTDKTWAKIQKRGTLIVGTSADYAPYEFHSTVNGQDKIVGFDMTMARTIAKKLGVKIKIEDMSFDALLGAVTTGKVDMVIAGMTATPERAKVVDFSNVYFKDKNVMLVKKTNVNSLKTVADFKGKKVVAQMASTQYDIAKATMKGANVIALKKVTDQATQVAQGKVAGMVVVSTTADTYLQQSSQFAVSKIKMPSNSNGSTIAMPKNSPVLKAKVNQIIKNDVVGAPLQGWKSDAIALLNKKESFFDKYWSYFVKGTGYTLGLAVIGVLAGAILGTLLALMKTSNVWVLKAIANVYIEFVRGTPLLIQVFIVFFGTQLIGLNVAGFVAGAVAMSLNSAAYVAEIIRSGINSIAKGQTEAARSLGLSKKQAMRYVVLPQAVKNILPALGNEFVTVIKEGSVVSVIGVGELTFQTSLVQGVSFKPFLPLMITALIYFTLTFVLSRLLNLAEKKLAKSN